MTSSDLDALRLGPEFGGRTLEQVSPAPQAQRAAQRPVAAPAARAPAPAQDPPPRAPADVAAKDRRRRLLHDRVPAQELIAACDELLAALEHAGSPGSEIIVEIGALQRDVLLAMRRLLEVGDRVRESRGQPSDLRMRACEQLGNQHGAAQMLAALARAFDALISEMQKVIASPGFHPLRARGE